MEGDLKFTSEQHYCIYCHKPIDIYKVNFNISAVLSIVAGAFSAYLVMAVSGVIREFSIKSGFVQISSKLEENIENVKNDLSESKRDVGEKISGLNTNMQSTVDLIL